MRLSHIKKIITMEHMEDLWLKLFFIELIEKAEAQMPQTLAGQHYRAVDSFRLIYSFTKNNTRAGPWRRALYIEYESEENSSCLKVPDGSGSI